MQWDRSCRPQYSFQRHWCRRMGRSSTSASATLVSVGMESGGAVWGLTPGSDSFQSTATRHGERLCAGKHQELWDLVACICCIENWERLLPTKERFMFYNIGRRAADEDHLQIANVGCFDIKNHHLQSAKTCKQIDVPSLQEKHLSYDFTKRPSEQ